MPKYRIRHKIRDALQTAANQQDGCIERLTVVAAHLGDGYEEIAELLMRTTRVAEVCHDLIV